MRQLSALKEETQRWRSLEQRVKDLAELVDISLQEDDVSLEQEVHSEVESISAELEKLDLQLLLSGDYDRRNAIVALHAGAGGVGAVSVGAVSPSHTPRRAKYTCHPERSEGSRSKRHSTPRDPSLRSE